MRARPILRLLLRYAVVALALVAAASARQDGARIDAPAATTTTTNATAADSLAIIVNASNPVDNLSFAELRQYFLGERTRWPNGRRVSLVMRGPGQPEREAMLRLVYHMRERDFHEHFLHARFTGALLEEPRVLDPSSRVLNFIFLRTGALGYVRASEVAGGPAVRVVRVDGLLPGEVGYKLTIENALRQN